MNASTLVSWHPGVVCRRHGKRVQIDVIRVEFKISITWVNLTVSSITYPFLKIQPMGNTEDSR